MGEPHATRVKETLLAELFQDADRVLDRMESVKSGLDEKLDETQRVVGEVARQAGAALERSAAAEREAWAREARAVTRDLTVLFGKVDARSRSTAWLIAVTALCSSVLGGVLVAIAMKA